MALGKICAICGADADTVEVAVDSFNVHGQPVGNRLTIDVCPVHLAEGIDNLVAQCKANIEAAIAA